jgi:hypothetical protein
MTAVEMPVATKTVAASGLPPSTVANPGGRVRTHSCIVAVHLGKSAKNWSGGVVEQPTLTLSMWSIVTGWMKVKNRDYSRYDLERKGAMKVRHDRHFLYPRGFPVLGRCECGWRFRSGRARFRKM